ncbi:MAG: type II/IV secretion system protein [Planctomycetes bacterium]|nr:type II/IV secretion system protein [Planctomycetota bacterium]
MSSAFIIQHSSFILSAASFPRGDGFYYNPFKFLAVLVIYLCWVRTCWWVDQDARQLKLPRKTWNPLLLGSGLLGLLAVWGVKAFLPAFFFLLLLYLGSVLSYVYVRNEKVDANEQVLTPRHLRRLAARLFKRKVRKEDDDEETPIPIRFVGKSSDRNEEDDARTARAAESRGYQSALDLVREALDRRSTDIHLEPTKEEMLVRLRIDGILQAATPFGRAMGDSVVNIFKVLAALDITEKRKPQDGSFSAVVDGSRSIDFRVATAGSVNGEKLVLRILDREGALLELARLGMRTAIREKVHGIVIQPHGLFIVCGPTGAGKSTTLYACLGQIDRYQKNVITVENPVEYHIDNVTQIEINPKAGKTFASELRSILRQDPDVIYIGEIRDQETAEIACQAAQTGHMVFTTLHANDTTTAIARLIDLGVAPFLIASALSAVLGQRLVRVLCPKCKVKYKPNADLLRKANLPAAQIKFFYRPTEVRPATETEEVESDEGKTPAAARVCPQCGGTGYRGRTGIFEMLVVTDRVRELIRENPNLNAIKQEAIKGGMKAMQEDGLRQVISGQTSIQELLRVCK